jgi:hypothetical protein
MSPEQLAGAEADTRTDIFAFGATLYEMVTARRAFDGDSTAAVISAVMTTAPPPLATAAPLAPAALDYVVQTCLAKDPDERLQSAHDLLVQLRWVQQAGSEKPGAAGRAAGRRGMREVLPWSLAGIAALALLALAWLHFRKADPPLRQVRLQITAPDRVIYANPFAVPAVSPDGQRLAFTGESPDSPLMLWMRPLNSTAAATVADTEGASLPVWSPDSRAVAFFAGGQLKRVDASGGPVQTICSLPAQARGGAWSRSGTIVFGTDNGPLYSVPASGGDPAALTALDRSRREVSHRGPQFLPDGRLLYMVQGGENAGVYVRSVAAGSAQLIKAGTSAARYADPGYLLFGQLDTLMAQRFDIRTLTTIGDPFPIAEQVGQGLYGMKVSVSDGGDVLVYSGAEEGASQLAWYGRDGKRQGSLSEPGAFRQVALSFDGKYVAVQRAGARGAPSDL